MPRKVLVQMYMTLDGFAELPEYPELTTESSRDFWELMWTGHWDDVDTLLLGRKTYERWAAFWPRMVNDKDKHFRAFARFSTRVEKIAFSRTLPSAGWSNSRIVRGEVAEEISRLRSLPGKNMVVGGGPRLVQSILEQDLADELYLIVFPSIIGGGKPLFGGKPDPDHYDDIVAPGAPGRHDYHLLEARGLRSGSVFLHYAVPRRRESAAPSDTRPKPPERGRRRQSDGRSKPMGRRAGSGRGNRSRPAS